MKILVTFTFDNSLKDWKLGGIIERELAVYKKLKDEGHEIGLLTYGDSTDLECGEYTQGVRVIPVYHYTKRPANKFLRYALSLAIPFRLSAIFRQYDVYKTNQMFGAWIPVMAKIFFRKKLIVRCGYAWLRNSLREKAGIKKIITAILGYKLEFFAYMAADRVILSSKSGYDFVKKLYPFFIGKAVIINNFVDTGLFRRIDTVHSEQDRVLFVGRISKEKNLENLLKAAAGLGKGVDIIGSGREKEKIERFICDNKIDARLLGPVKNSDLSQEINRYKVFALVSFYEWSPKALLESMACERVVVCSDVEGIQEVVRDNVSGILTGTDAESIKNGLKKAFGMSENEKNLMGKRAREGVAEKYSFKTIYRIESGIYRELSGGRP